MHKSESSFPSIFTSLLSISFFCVSIFFFFNDTATTEIYTLSLHDALPICLWIDGDAESIANAVGKHFLDVGARSEEHTSELQSQFHLVCRLLLEKKKTECSLIVIVYQIRDHPFLLLTRQCRIRFLHLVSHH